MDKFIGVLKQLEGQRLAHQPHQTASRSISIVEYKVAQAHFFLEQMESAGTDFFAVQCLADAFAAACRSITFSMQAVIKIDGFATWYAARQKALDADPLARFFNAYRVASTHIGETVVRAGTTHGFKDGKLRMKYYFMPVPDLQVVPNDDVLTICTTHFKTLLALTFDALEHFKYNLDDRWYFTSDNFGRMGKGIGDALQELGFPREWLTAGNALAEQEAWKALRYSETVGCQLNRLFSQYLDKIIQGPDDVTPTSPAGNPSPC